MLNILTKKLVCGYLVQGADFWGSYVLKKGTTVATHRFGPVSEGVPNRLIVADQGCSLSHF